MLSDQKQSGSILQCWERSHGFEHSGKLQNISGTREICAGDIILPRKSLIRSSLSSLQVLAELLAVPFTSRFTCKRSLASSRSLTDSMRSLSVRSEFWVLSREPRSLTGELSLVLRSWMWSVAGTMRSLSIRSDIGGPLRELRSLPGELSRVLWSPECLRRLCSVAAGVRTVETFDSELLVWNFWSLELCTVASAEVSFTGSKFCTTAMSDVAERRKSREFDVYNNYYNLLQNQKN